MIEIEGLSDSCKGKEGCRKILTGILWQPIL